VALSVCVGLFVVLIAPLVPMIYGQTGDVRDIAVSLLHINACMMPMHAFMNSSYFTIRSGGKTLITFLFDSGFVWVLMIPLTWTLSRYTLLPIIPLFAICQSTEFLKCVFGFVLVKKGVWAKNIVNNES